MPVSQTHPTAVSPIPELVKQELRERIWAWHFQPAPGEPPDQAGLGKPVLTGFSQTLLVSKPWGVTAKCTATPPTPPWLTSPPTCLQGNLTEPSPPGSQIHLGRHPLGPVSPDAHLLTGIAGSGLPLPPSSHPHLSTIHLTTQPGVVP